MLQHCIYVWKVTLVLPNDFHNVSLNVAAVHLLDLQRGPLSPLRQQNCCLISTEDIDNKIIHLPYCYNRLTDAGPRNRFYQMFKPWVSILGTILLLSVEKHCRTPVSVLVGYTFTLGVTTIGRKRTSFLYHDLSYAD